MPELHRFHGGLCLEGHKADSLARGLVQAPLPAQLILPLRQHIGEYNKPLVDVGTRVRKGETIAATGALISAPLHAPSSGIVRAIENRPVAHPSGLEDMCIVIDVDGDDEAAAVKTTDPDSLTGDEILVRIAECGIAGLGGAVFPSAAKLARGLRHGIDTLIVNGVECEPYITCDDMLMREYAAETLRGCAYLQRLLKPKRTFVAIEDNKPEAIESMSRQLADMSLAATEIVVVPTIYPSGGEKQLIQTLTGKEVPHGQLAFDIGILCQNVGTCAAIAAALERAEPLISRIVTLAGDKISQPGNFETRLGTPISHLVDLAGGYLDGGDAFLVMGGPMMGFALTSDAVPIVKASNCILAMREETVPREPGPHAECIRCGKCTQVCPARLLPQQLYWHARAHAWERIREFRLSDCIECGCCSAVCPSGIPLVQYYRAAKSEIRAQQKAQFKSDRARARFEFRERRLLLKKQQEEERRRLKREALQKNRKRAAGESEADPVRAALERVRERKKTLQDEIQ